MRWLTLAALLLIPAAAYADPVSVLAIASSIATATGYTVVATWLTVAAISASIYGGIEARRKAKRDAARSRAEYNASLSDRFVTALTADPPWRIVYGRCITGGDVVAILTSDKTAYKDDGTTYDRPDAYKHLVIALAAHEVQAINEVYIDGIAVGTLDGSGWATGGDFGGITKTYTMQVTIAAGASYTFPGPPTVLALGYYSVTTNEWVEPTFTVSGNQVTNTGSESASCSVSYTMTTSLVRVEKALGTDSQTASAYLQSVCPSEWTTTDRMRGIAYIVVTIDLDEQRFQGGPPAITADVSGKKLYDPRTTTTVWSNNPALVIRDYLLGEYGFNVTSAEIDDDSFTAAANACDALIDVTVGATTTTDVATYTCDGVVTTDQKPEAVLDDLANSMGGFCTHSGGLWIANAGAYTAPVLALTEDTQAGPIDVIQAGVGFDELFNGVRGQMVEDGRAVVSDFDPYQNSTYVTADGDELWANIALPFTNNRARARNLARILTEQARESLVIRYPAMLHAWPLQIGDRVTVTNSEYGWTAKVFRVTDWQFSIDAPVVLTLQEDADTVYDLADAATVDEAPNTGLPDPWSVPSISSLAAASGDTYAVTLSDASRVPRVKVSWAAISSAYVTNGGYVLVRWRRVQDAVGQWQEVRVAGDQASEYLIGMEVGDVLIIGARAVNSLGAEGAESFIAHGVEAIDPAEIGGTNLLPNSSFELESSTAGRPEYWTSLTSNGVTADLAIETSVSYHADSCFKFQITNTSGATSNAHVLALDSASAIQVQEGQLYTLSMYQRLTSLASNYKARLQIGWFSDAAATTQIGSYVTVYDHEFSAAVTWERDSGVVQAPATAVAARVRFGILRPSTGDTATGTIRFDAIDMKVGDALTGYSPGDLGTWGLLPDAATEVAIVEDETTRTATAFGYYDWTAVSFTAPCDCIISATAVCNAYISASPNTGAFLLFFNINGGGLDDFAKDYVRSTDSTNPEKYMLTNSAVLSAGDTMVVQTRLQSLDSASVSAVRMQLRVEIIKR